MTSFNKYNGKISPVISLAVLNLFGIAVSIFILVGMLYLFDANDKESAERQRLQQIDNAKDNKLQTTLLNLVEQQVNSSKERFKINQDEERKDTEEINLVRQVLQQQGNLTTDQREKLIVALEQNIDVIPILKNQTTEMLNATNQMLNFIKFITQSFDEEYLIDEVRQYGQSNNTYGNLTSIQEKLDTILSSEGNNTQ